MSDRHADHQQNGVKIFQFIFHKHFVQHGLNISVAFPKIHPSTNLATPLASNAWVESVLGSSQHVLCDGIFHAKHGEARAVQPTILDVHERTGSSIRKSENGSCYHFLVAQFYQQASWHLDYYGDRMHRCVCLKKWKHYFLHTLVNRILDGAFPINSSNLQSPTIARCWSMYPLSDRSWKNLTCGSHLLRMKCVRVAWISFVLKYCSFNNYQSQKC